MTCTNNCKREDPNSVIMGTVATNGITSLDGWYSCIYFFSLHILLLYSTSLKGTVGSVLQELTR